MSISVETDLLAALDHRFRQELDRQQNRCAAVAEALDLGLQAPGVWRRCGRPTGSWASWRVVIWWWPHGMQWPWAAYPWSTWMAERQRPALNC